MSVVRCNWWSPSDCFQMFKKKISSAFIFYVPLWYKSKKHKEILHIFVFWNLMSLFFVDTEFVLLHSPT